jgi:hypothetical protein
MPVKAGFFDKITLKIKIPPAREWLLIGHRRKSPARPA